MRPNELNPFNARLAPLYSERASLQMELDGEIACLDSVLNFDHDTAVRLVSEQNAKAGLLTEEAKSLKRELDVAERRVLQLSASRDAAASRAKAAKKEQKGLAGRIVDAGQRGKFGLFGMRLAFGLSRLGIGESIAIPPARGSREVQNLNEALIKAVQRRDVLAATFDRLANDAARILNEGARRLKTLRDNHEFDIDGARQRKLEIESRLARVLEEIGDLEYRRRKLDEVLGPLPEEIAKDSADLERLRSKHKMFKDLADMLGAIDGSAPDAGVNRKKIHEKCAELAGKSRNKADYKNEAEFRRAGDPTANAQAIVQQMEAVDRSLRKRLSRARELIDRAELKVSELLIDGSNMCFESNGSGRVFIGLGALTSCARWLSENRNEIKVKIFFDPSIRSRLGQWSTRNTAGESRSILDREISEAFDGLAKIHICEGSADETMLSMADGPSVYVLSNDKFADFSSKKAVQSRRIIRYDMFDGQLVVPNLDMAVKYAT